QAMRAAFRARLSSEWADAIIEIGYGGYGFRGALDNYFGAIDFGTWNTGYTAGPPIKLSRVDDYNEGCVQDVYFRPAIPWAGDRVSGAHMAAGLWRPMIDAIHAR